MCIENDRDFFSDITEDDIIADNDSGFQVTDELPDTPTELFEYYNSHYKYVLFVKANDLQLVDNGIKIIETLIKRVSYFLEQMGVEYSDFIIRDSWTETLIYRLNIINIKNLKFISAYSKTELLKCGDKLSNLFFLDRLYITTFINIPDYDNDVNKLYRFLYRFLYRLITVVGGIGDSGRLLTDIVLSRLPFGVNSFYTRLRDADELTNTLKLFVEYKHAIDNDINFEYKQYLLNDIKRFLNQ